MKRFVRISAALAFAFASLSANAADVAVAPQYKAAPVFNWTGFYGGIHAGYVNGETDGIAAFGLAEAQPKGAFFGLTAGYNWQLSPNWVVGLEADISTGDVGDSFLFGVVNLEQKMFGTFRGRAGYNFGTGLLYVTGGLAWAQTNATLLILNDRQMMTGWTVGAGYEWALDNRWSAKLEYLYTDLDQSNFFAGLIPGGVPVGINSHTFKVGVNYRFGR